MRMYAFAAAGFALGFVTCALLSAPGYVKSMRAEMTFLYRALNVYTLPGSEWCVVPVNRIRELFAGRIDNAEKAEG